MPYAFGNYGYNWDNSNNWNSWNNWDSMGSWGSWGGWSSGNSGSSGSSSSSKTKTQDEIRAERRKKYEENSKKIKENQVKIDELEKSKQYNDDIIEKAKKGEAGEDGVIKIQESMEDYKKLSFWKKALRAGSNYIQGNWKLATSFFGEEQDPKTGESKWKWQKCLKNFAIAGGCLALTAIPVVGPFIGAGLLATGLVAGAVGVGKGIYKTIEAKTPEDIDKGWQDIGAGVTIGVASAAGLRGLGKAAQTSAATAAAPPSGGFWSTLLSPVKTFVKNPLSCTKAFAKDITVNAFKATKAAAQADKANVAANGFFKTWGANIKNFIPKLGKSKYENGKNDINGEFDTQVNKITERLDEIRNVDIKALKAQPNYKNTPEYQALKDESMLLKSEKSAILKQKSDFNNTVTQDGFRSLSKESYSHKETKFWNESAHKLEVDGFVDIPTSSGGTYRIKLKADKSNIKPLKDLAWRSEQRARQMEYIAQLRKSTIKKMAFRKDMKFDVETYTGTTRSGRLGRIWDAYKPAKSDITFWGCVKAPFKLVWEAMMIPFKPWAWLQKTPTSTFFKVEETILPAYEQDMFMAMLGQQLGMGPQILTMEVEGQNEKGETVKQQTAVTKDLLAQLETAKKEYDQTLDKLKEEQRKLSVA